MPASKSSSVVRDSQWDVDDETHAKTNELPLMSEVNEVILTFSPSTDEGKMNRLFVSVSVLVLISEYSSNFTENCQDDIESYRWMKLISLRDYIKLSVVFVG